MKKKIFHILKNTNRKWRSLCNSCKCDNYYQCSIVGYINSPGFCCSKCEGYDEELTCLKARFNYERIVPKTVIKHPDKKIIIPNE